MHRVIPVQRLSMLFLKGASCEMNNMTPMTHILICLLFACGLHMSAFAKRSTADSVIRIIGDGGIHSQNDSSGLPAAESSPTPVSSTTIRIIGDKLHISRSPSSDQAVRPDDEVKTAAYEESLSKKTPEQEMAERLEALRMEKERRDAEKLELERLAKLKAEQVKSAAEAARIESIKREQELLRKIEKL